jgi:protoheme IX farnesyltransferase
MNPWRRRLVLLLELTKFRLSLFVALSAATGFILAYQGIDLKMLPVLSGVFLLASGASALNQCQERKEDLLMERTKGRPIPSERLSPLSALTISFFLLASGFCLLSGFNDLETYGLGIVAVLLYNGVYTPLKKRTLFAVLPGALVGALPPAIGWSSGGGQMEPQIFALCSFFFIWQIPHSWLLLLDYRKDCEKAGFPSFVQTGDQNQVEKISWVWIFATVVCSLLIPLFGLGNSLFNLGGLLLLGLLLIWRASKTLLIRSKTDSLRFVFRTINFYMLSVMALFSLDQLF